MVGQVVAKGPIHDYVPLLSESVKHTLQHLGVKDLSEVTGGNINVRVEKRSFQAQREGMVHNLYAYEK